MTIASASARPLLVPFSLRLNPVQRLLLLSFRRDPIYTGLEVQRFEQPDGVGRGIAVIATRRDRHDDIYFDPALTLDPSYQVGSGIGAGVASWTPTEMQERRFEVTDQGVQLDLAFDTLAGRRLAVHVHEHRRRPPTRFTLLAPAGFRFKDPTFFPLFCMNDFSFVGLRARTTVTVDGRRRPVVRLGVPWRLPRYGLAPMTAICDEQRSGAVPVLQTRGPGQYGVDGSKVTVVDRDGCPHIAELSAGNGERGLSVRYRPPVPSLVDMDEEISLRGRVEVCVDGIQQLEGGYRVRRRGALVDLVTEIDQPGAPTTRVCPRALFGVLRFFRTWPTTYRWSATVNLDDVPPAIRSGWDRVRPRAARPHRAEVWYPVTTQPRWRHPGLGLWRKGASCLT